VITDENGHVTEVHTDFLGRKILERKIMEDGSNIDTKYLYEGPAGQLSEIIQPNNQSFTYNYDNLNRLTSKTIPGVGEYTFSGYNANDLYSTSTDPANTTFTYTYDTYGQVDKIKTGGKILSNFTYGTSGGANGQVKSEAHAILPLSVNDSTITNHLIDGFGRNVGMSFSSPEGTYNTSSVLDDADRLMSSSVSGNGIGATYTYDHDAYGRNYITNQTMGLNTEKLSHSILNGSNDWVKQVRQGGVTNPLHTIGYGYNLRGWITGIGACAGEPTSGGPGTGGNPADEKENQQWGAIVFQYNMADICAQKATKLDISWNALSGDPNNPDSTSIDESIKLFGIPAVTLNLDDSETILYQGPISPAQIATQIINRIAFPSGSANPSPNCLIALESEFGTYLKKVIEDKLGKTPQGQDPGGPVTATIFGIALQYDNPIGSATPQYNGNISSMQWCTALGENYTYEFEYDNINRISSSKSNYGNRYGTDYSYDKVGNILSIQRNGVIGELNNAFSYGLTDQLELDYIDSRLEMVTEVGNQDYGFKGATKNYLYDGNGNMTTAGDVTIGYTITNMPHLFITENETILVTYDAAGNKIKKETPDYVKTYFGPIEFKDGAFEALYHDQGRTIPAEGGFRTEYNIKDHLGSVRVTYSDIDGNGTIDYGSELLQENHYYPFGMVWEGTRLMPEAPNVVNPYQYNGKELNEEIGWLDYGARWYDPSIGRWNAVDPMAEKMPSWSTYNYTFNNPVRFIDPDGMLPSDPTTRRLGRMSRAADKQFKKDYKKGFNKSRTRGFERGFRFVESKSGKIKLKGKVKSGQTSGGELRMIHPINSDGFATSAGDGHTHPVGSEDYGTGQVEQGVSFSGEDIMALGSSSVKKDDGFVSMIETGSDRQALVVVDGEKARDFLSGTNAEELNSSIGNRTAALYQSGMSVGDASKQAVSEIIGDSDNSGIQFYSTSTNKNKFDEYKKQ